MHPNRAFHMHDSGAIRAMVGARGFGMIVASTVGGLRVAHVPVIVASDGRLEFHLARSNPMAQIDDGTELLFICNGPDGYISPDWYGLPDQVPTWNYVAVEAEGSLRRLPDTELPGLLERLSGLQEQRLHPKPAWHHDKMASGLFDRMLKGIIGFSMDVREWRGTAKLGQTKSADAMRSAAAGARRAGNSALAALMEGCVA